MKTFIKTKFLLGVAALCTILCLSFTIQTSQAQPQMDPDQMVQMMGGMIGIQEGQKEEFTKIMMAFFEKISPLIQEAMSGQVDQAAMEAKMTELGAGLEEDLKKILTEEQMQTLQAMQQQQMGGAPQ